MSALWVPQLLADFEADASVPSGEYGIAKGHRLLAHDCSNHTRKVVLLCLEAFRPSGEPTGLAIAPVVTHLHLGTDEEDLLVQKGHTTIVDDVAMLHGHAHIDQHVLADGRGQQLQEYFPGVEESVWLQEVILTTVATEVFIEEEGRSGRVVLSKWDKVLRLLFSYVNMGQT